jgi:hypothetical protein
MPDSIAPEGAVFMCAACGRLSKTLYGLGDTSCVTWGVLVKEASIITGANGAKYAQAWDKEDKANAVDS